MWGTIRAGFRHLGTRLLLSYLAVILVASTAGVVAALLLPVTRYQQLMLEIMHPPRNASVAAMDGVVARAVTQAVIWHVTLSLVVAVVVSIVLSGYVSTRLAASIERIKAASGRLAAGHYEDRLPGDPITEIDELEHNLNKLAQSLGLRRDRRMLAIASVGHELRTPLTALRGYVDAVRDGVLPMNADVIDRLDYAVIRLERMASDLSALARAEDGGTLALDMQVTDLREAAEKATLAGSGTAQEHGVHLTLSGSSEKVLVRCDPVRLGEVLDNIVSNSLAHTPAGRTVTIGVEAADVTRARVWVSDEGEGIRREDLPHVTEPFFRVLGESSGRTPRPGMGLGLAIAERLVTAMGGTLTVQSAGPGFGTTVSVYLPRG